jgi:glyoxylate reductase
MPTRVLVTLQLPREDLAPLDTIADLELVFPDDPLLTFTPDQVRAELAKAPTHAILTQGELAVTADLLEAAPDLKIVANCAMGIDNLDLAALDERGIVATNTPDAFVESTADLTLGLLLALARNFRGAENYAREGRWANEGKKPRLWEGTLLQGKTLGLIGYGRIAKAVETRARAFGLEVIHTRAHLTDDPNCRSMDDLLASADIVTVHPPLTADTRHLIDAAAFSKMQPGTLFINVARGPVVDEQALVDALTSGHLGGAGLDVFEQEPKIHSGLLDLDSVVLLPHIGGATREERRKGRLQAAENIARVLNGTPPLNPVSR